MKLLVVSSVVHYRHQGRLWAYAAYAREIDIWADLFEQVLIAAPCRESAPAALAAPFSRSNIDIAPQHEVGGRTIAAKVGVLLALPTLGWGLMRAMRAVDAVHVRCPCTLGLLGVLLAPMAARRRVAKYAGQWEGYPGEPWSFRLQRRLLGSRWWGAPVTVYGARPGEPPHVVPFFTSVLTEAQLERARAAAARKVFDTPLKVLFTGRLTASKNVDVLLRAVARLRAEGLAIECAVVGDGPERAALERLAGGCGIAPQVHFTGGLPFERVLDYYERCHVLALVSETEGWPKSVAEAMAFGLVPVGSNRGLVPGMLGDGRGFVVPPRDVEALAGVLREMALRPEPLAGMSARAAAWGRGYSLEGLREALRALLAKRWSTAP